MFIQLATKNLKRSILIKQTYFFIFYRLNPRYFNITFFTSFIAKEILKYGVSSSTYKKKYQCFIYCQQTIILIRSVLKYFMASKQLMFVNKLKLFFLCYLMVL